MKTLRSIVAVFAMITTIAVFAADVATLKAKAATGDTVAQNKLGWMHYHGEGVKKNRKEAFKWYQKAAKQGNAKAQANLGWLYSNGKGVRRDHKEAFKWWKKPPFKAMFQRNII